MWDLQEEGYVTSGRRVRRLARAAGLQCVHPGPSARTTVQDSRAIGGLVDLVDRQFTAPEPDQLWVGDITYIWTYSGFAYLATLIDMCSIKVVGWAVDDHMRTDLVLEAVDNALAARGPGIGIGELVVHHDRGSQYTSGRYRDRLFAEGIIVAIQPEWRHAGSVAGFGAWVPVRHASACGWPDLPGSGAWCVRVVVYGGAVAGGSQGWPVNSRVRASSASMPHLPAVDR